MNMQIDGHTSFAAANGVWVRLADWHEEGGGWFLTLGTIYEEDQ